MGQFIDMTGWVMKEHGVPDSRITVIKRSKENNKEGRAMWVCECACGTSPPFISLGKNIRNGNTKSCGCLMMEVLRRPREHRERPKKGNKYYVDLKDDYGTYGYGLCSNTNAKFYFDMEDYETISKYTWREYVSYTKNSQMSKLMTNCVKENGEKTNITMHELLGCKYYDHADRNELNNRRYNLRPCTPQENSRNRRIPSSNTSGFIGVCWDKNNNKWMSKIVIDGKNIHLGRFVDKGAAIKTRLEAEAVYFKEFAPQRHLFEEYGININTGR